jgi:hypothetical protein
VAVEFDLDKALRRLKPERYTTGLARRADVQLQFADAADLVGRPLLLDTCVYLHVLQERTPRKVDDLLRSRKLNHSATVVSELVNRFGARLPANDRERAALDELAGTVRDIPRHRMISPTVAIWGEAGILAGLRARVGGFSKRQEQDALNDALIFLQGLASGSVVLTENIADFDVLQQIVPSGRVLFYRALP